MKLDSTNIFKKVVSVEEKLILPCFLFINTNDNIRRLIFQLQKKKKKKKVRRKQE